MYPPERHRLGLSPYKGPVATATNNVHLAPARRRSPGQGTGTWISEEPQMTLTYRGSSYEIGSKLPLVQPIVELQYRGKSYQARTSAAPAQVHATLTFRGASYAK